ncbi:MAG: M36 family metallopeptidase [Acidobacteria bacterium]|nr:M36 family metallopeptidase [Acidobacteriota bacterium]
MKYPHKARAAQKGLFTLLSLVLVAALAVIPAWVSVGAGDERSAKSPVQDNSGHSHGLPNFDIRSDKPSYEKLMSLRLRSGVDAAAVADMRDTMAAAETQLKEKVPQLEVVYNRHLRTPELITPSVKHGKAFLTDASPMRRTDILRRFLNENSALVGLSGGQMGQLKEFSDYSNPEGELAFVEMEQEIDGIMVFRGGVKAGFNRQGQIIRVINNIAPGLDAGLLSKDFGDPTQAVNAAYQHINADPGLLPRMDNAVSDDSKAVFGEGDRATTAQKVYFPTEPGVAVPAWLVLIWQPVDAYYVVVDANSGMMLWRKNITEHQSQLATYNVYANPNAMINLAESPAPLTPGPVDPNTGTQGSLLTRTNITLVGNEGLYSFNNNGWITNDNNTTDGNNVEAGLDLTSPDGIDAGTQAVGDPNRVFSSAWNPPPGNPAPGDAPSHAESRRGAVIQMFYAMNRYHDELYRLGFTEAARNFQHNNFGRGGVQGDRISAEGQDSSSTNNANFGTGMDGVRGRMQMFVFTPPTPQRDGTADMDIMLHEVTHGTSNRLHGNALGLGDDMSRGMGEGWSDFYAHALLSEPSDPIDGVYSTGGYALLQGFNAIGTRNYYYGIRRFPKAIMSSTGGPNNRPHNPLTFADIDQTQMSLSDGAFPVMTGPHVSTTADQVHAAGEVWSTALWEVRAKFVQRLGWEVGNRRILQYVTDGMKINPFEPSFIEARDSILIAAIAGGTAEDVRDVWTGFAIRGMGAGASVQHRGGYSVGGTGTTRVTESFDLPNLTQTTPISVIDTAGNNNGYAEPGENVKLLIALGNRTGWDATGVTLSIENGGSADYGTIPHDSGAGHEVDFTVPDTVPCGGALEITLNVNSSLGPVTFTRTLFIGVPQTTLEEDFDDSSSIPDGWTATSVAGGPNFVVSSARSHTAPNAMFALEPSTVGGGSDLTSPSIPISAPAAQLSFHHWFATEDGWDGAVLEISIGDGPFQDILAAGGKFQSNGYTGLIRAGTNNPLSNRDGWEGNSGGFIETRVQLPSSANGQNIRLRWRTGSDNNTVVRGWDVDTIKVTGSYSCPYEPQPGISRARADFDGDGKTDISIFRPSTSLWYLERSTEGLAGVLFGLASDIIVPGDYDGDGKTDVAVYRPSTGVWYLLRSTEDFGTVQFGEPGDIPVPADYDGDGRTDFATYRPSNGRWYIWRSTGGQTSVTFGAAADLPVPGDYDGDGKADIAIFRNGNWWILKSSTNTNIVVTFGFGTDKPVNADYDGDGADDVAVFRPSNGVWYIFRSGDGGVSYVQFGMNGDLPVPGDYDGDGKSDPAIFRNGTWWINRSTGGHSAHPFGFGDDRPAPAAYLPR